MARNKGVNFKTEKYKYLRSLILVIIFVGSIVIFFALAGVNMYTLNTGDWVDITIFIIGSLVLLRASYPMVVFLGSSLFDVTFYKDRFEIKRIIKNITIVKNRAIFYEDIVSLKEVSPIFGMYQNKTAEATLLEIKLKNKKTIYIMLSAIKEENKVKLLNQFEKYTELDLDFEFRFIFKFKL